MSDVQTHNSLGIDTSWDGEVLFRRDRVEIFVKRLAHDVAILTDIGLDRNMILAVLRTLKYVQFWLELIPYIYPVKRLPKGHTWKEAEKYRIDGNGSITFWILPIGDDLYIRAKELGGVGMNKPPGLLCITDYRSRTYQAMEYDMITIWHDFNSSLRDVLLEYWHKHGLELGTVVKITREVDKREYGQLSLFND